MIMTWTSMEVMVVKNWLNSEYVLKVKQQDLLIDQEIIFF